MSINNTLQNTSTITVDNYVYLSRNTRVTLTALLLIVGVLGNCLVLWVMWKRRKTRKNHHYFIMQLATVDTIFLVACITDDFFWFYKVHKAFQKWPSLLMTILCKLYFPLKTFCFLLSIFILTAIAYERYRTLVTPFKRKFRKKEIWLVFGLQSLLSVFLVIPLIMVSGSADGYCFGQWPAGTITIRRAYMIAITFIQYIVPLILIALFYVKIGLHLRKYSKLYSAKAGNRKESRCSQSLVIRRQQNIKVCKMFLVVIVIFAISVLPLNVTWLWHEFFLSKSVGDNTIAFVFFIASLFSYFQSCSNPIIYGIMGSGFSKRIQLLKRRIPTDSSKNIFASKRMQSDKKTGRIWKNKKIKRNSSTALCRNKHAVQTNVSMKFTRFEFGKISIQESSNTTYESGL